MICSAGQFGSPSRLTCASTSSLSFGAAIVVGAEESSCGASILERSLAFLEPAPVGFLPELDGFAAGLGAIAAVRWQASPNVTNPSQKLAKKTGTSHVKSSHSHPTEPHHACKYTQVCLCESSRLEPPRVESLPGSALWHHGGALLDHLKSRHSGAPVAIRRHARAGAPKLRADKWRGGAVWEEETRCLIRKAPLCNHSKPTSPPHQRALADTYIFLGQGW
jgi:hypothetical protein